MHYTRNAPPVNSVKAQCVENIGAVDICDRGVLHRERRYNVTDAIIDSGGLKCYIRARSVLNKVESDPLSDSTIPNTIYPSGSHQERVN